MMPYILHVALILAGCLVFYKLLLQRETFFRVNRFVLLAGLGLAFALPLVPVPAQWSLRSAPVEVQAVPHPDALTGLAGRDDAAGAGATLPAVGAGTVAATPGPAKEARTKAPFDAAQWIRFGIGLYWFGVLAFGLNFLLQVGVLLYRVRTRPVIRDGRYTIVELDGDKAPCSFGPYIFINPEKYDWDTYNQILEHEKVHIRQGHTWDILFAELVLIFQWFNPFAWTYRRTLESNLEYLTDSSVLEAGATDAEQYQMSLLRVSAPHFPLSLTTNYNQSLLKKRVLMMNAKRSNLHTAWKYGFLLPLLLLLVSVLNEPMAQSKEQNKTAKTERKRTHNGIETEGAWFATIKGDKVQVQFRSDDDDNNSMNGSTFPLADFGTLPRDAAGSFRLKRDAGTMEFTGRFEGNGGMGRYKFVADPSFNDYLKGEGIAAGDDRDQMVLFFVNVTRTYIGELKAAGYKNFDRDELIPLAALNVNGAYIQSLQAAGLKNVSLQDLIPLRSLGVDKAYIEDIRKVYPNVDPGRLITLKAQGIDSKYVEAVRSSNSKGRAARDSGYRSRPDNGRLPALPPDPAIPALPADPDDEDAVAGPDFQGGKPKTKEKIKNKVKEKHFDNSGVAGAGAGAGAGTYSDRDVDDMVAMKSLNVTEEYIRSIREAGFPDLSNRQAISFKSLGVTADYINGLRAMGFSNLRANDVTGAKSVHVTADFVKGFAAVGFGGLKLDHYISFKALGITPGLVKQYQDLGFTNVRPNDITGAKATGTTPDFIARMQQQGYKLSSLNKYIDLKTVVQ
ncbi:M56 family metallopeptidase [Flaviaesturariibacter amylovorans]|uniref:Peptidase M56 domain-containing protein n=1 Tax=Flaviaesturariibacter amylovorans TaxID=1084520 RepID=A0ABP8HD95_9BACT